MLTWLKSIFRKEEVKMKQYNLFRFSSTEQGTFGVFCDSNTLPICVTAERPWLGNERRISCIPEGLYICKKYSSPKYHNVWEVKDVPERTSILIHEGNFPVPDKNGNNADSTGCILVGDSFGIIRGRHAVLKSVVTLNRLRGILPEEFELNIRGLNV